MVWGAGHTCAHKHTHTDRSRVSPQATFKGISSGSETEKPTASPLAGPPIPRTRPGKGWHALGCGAGKEAGLAVCWDTV